LRALFFFPERDVLCRQFFGLAIAAIATAIAAAIAVALISTSLTSLSSF
jgi:hypothetical protein